jgi:hypothetical protein
LCSHRNIQLFKDKNSLIILSINEKRSYSFFVNHLNNDPEFLSINEYFRFDAIIMQSKLLANPDNLTGFFLLKMSNRPILQKEL